MSLRVKLLNINKRDKIYTIRIFKISLIQNINKKRHQLNCLKGTWMRFQNLNLLDFRWISGIHPNTWIETTINFMNKKGWFILEFMKLGEGQSNKS